MAKTLEQLAEEIFQECLKDGEPVTKEEALEMARMEGGAKEIKNYNQAEKPKEKTKREVKQDEEKVKLIKDIAAAIGSIATVEIKNPQREITFKINGNDYSLTLTKHRPGK